MSELERKKINLTEEQCELIMELTRPAYLSELTDSIKFLISFGIKVPGKINEEERKLIDTAKTGKVFGTRLLSYQADAVSKFRFQNEIKFENEAILLAIFRGIKHLQENNPFGHN
jgi:hypothetical protein